MSINTCLHTAAMQQTPNSRIGLVGMHENNNLLPGFCYIFNGNIWPLSQESFSIKVSVR